MRPQPLTGATVAAHLPTYWADASCPAPADLAERIAAAWNAGSLPAPDGERYRAGVDAVVDTVFPLGFSAEFRGGVEAVGEFISTAAHQASARLDDATDPGRVVRGLLTQLAAAAHDEVQRGREPRPNDAGNYPLPRTYIAASGDNRARTDAQRAAAAAGVAWLHGHRDGWGEAYWAANRIANAVRHSEISATSAIGGVPAIAWLDDLAEAARAIAGEWPAQHPARLARLAGPNEPTLTTPDDRPAAAAPPTTPIRPEKSPDKSDRKPRGM